MSAVDEPPVCLDGASIDDLALPMLSGLGALAACRQGLDMAVATRRGILVLGEKGTGKSVGLNEACGWFRSIERQKHEDDDTYRVRRILRCGGLRMMNYRGVAIHLCGLLARDYNDRNRGRRKQEAQIRAEFVQLCLKKRYTVLTIDDAENCSAEALLLLRDLMADAEAADPKRYATPGATAPGGIGILIVGTDAIERQLLNSPEAGQRWAKLIRVENTSPEDVPRVYRTWLPGFAAHIAERGEDAWVNYITSTVCRGGEVVLRTLDNHVRAYLLEMLRTYPEIRTLAEVPFDREVFEGTLHEALWGERSALPSERRHGRRRK